MKFIWLWAREDLPLGDLIRDGVLVKLSPPLVINVSRWRRPPVAFDCLPDLCFSQFCPQIQQGQTVCLLVLLNFVLFLQLDSFIFGKYLKGETGCVFEANFLEKDFVLSLL
jgi:hypothetical protein